MAALAFTLLHFTALTKLHRMMRCIGLNLKLLHA
jgi:hypothetical protein